MHCSGQPKSTYVISRLEGVTNVPKELGRVKSWKYGQMYNKEGKKVNF